MTDSNPARASRPANAFERAIMAQSYPQASIRPRLAKILLATVSAAAGAMGGINACAPQPMPQQEVFTFNQVDQNRDDRHTLDGSRERQPAGQWNWNRDGSFSVGSPQSLESFHSEPLGGYTLPAEDFDRR